jgi:hypothetical protein
MLAPAGLATANGRREHGVGGDGPTRASGNGNGGATREQLEAMLRGVADAVTAQAPDGPLSTRTLSRGDALVFFTDGVIEPRGTGETLDELRLAELVAGCAGREADAIAAELEQAAVRAHDGRPRDDIAVLVLRVAP